MAVNIQSCGDKAALVWLQGLALEQPEEQARVRKFHFDNDQHRSLSGRLLIRYAIARDLGHRPRDLGLKRTPAGKPCVPPSSMHPAASLTVSFIERVCACSCATVQISRHSAKRASRHGRETRGARLQLQRDAPR